MKLAVISHKACWYADSEGRCLATLGGFPAQIGALSELFDETQLVVPIYRTAAPAYARVVEGYHLSHRALDPLPSGKPRRRRLPLWLLRNGRRIWQAVSHADAVHAIVPGDVGTFGWLAALAQRKPLFVRHAGQWERRSTLAQKVWPWLMEATAGGRNIMLATGMASTPPSQRNPEIGWIFSTSLSIDDLESCRPKQARRPNNAPKLLVAARQVPGKGTDIVIDALPLLIDHYPNVHIEIAGDGPMLPKLKAQVAAQGLDERVTFYGHVAFEKINKLMHQADVLCLPSASEGFSKTTLEALACGLPVVATAVTFPPHILRDCGIVLAERSPEALAEAVVGCLSDGDCYQSMSQNGVIIARGFSCERWRDEIGERLEAAWGALRGG